MNTTPDAILVGRAAHVFDRAERLLSAAAAQLGQAIEGADLRREATEAEILWRSQPRASARM